MINPQRENRLPKNHKTNYLSISANIDNSHKGERAKGKKKRGKKGKDGGKTAGRSLGSSSG
jgi:hypothetical protein